MENIRLFVIAENVSLCINPFPSVDGRCQREPFAAWRDTVQAQKIALWSCWAGLSTSGTGRLRVTFGGRLKNVIEIFFSTFFYFSRFLWYNLFLLQNFQQNINPSLLLQPVDFVGGSQRLLGISLSNSSLSMCPWMDPSWCWRWMWTSSLHRI